MKMIVMMMIVLIEIEVMKYNCLMQGSFKSSNVWHSKPRQSEKSNEREGQQFG